MRKSPEGQLRRVLWIHGWGTSPQVWKSMQARLTAEGSGLHAENRWIHCDFSYVDCQDVSSMFEALQRRMEELRPEAVVAWSMGGLLLLDWLIRGYRPMGGCGGDEVCIPPGLTRLIMVGSTLQFSDDDRSRGWPMRVLERMQAKLRADRDEVLRQFTASMFTGEELEERGNWEGLLQLDTDMSAEGLQAGLAYLATATVREAWASKLVPLLAGDTLRVLWLHGELDPICPIGAMPGGVYGLERVILEGAGHAPFLTQQAVFYERLRRFLG